MSVLNKAKEHYTSQVSGEMQTVMVPEWDTTVYYKTTNNFASQQRILKLHGEGKVVEALVETLVVKALDQNGKRLFTPGDRDVLMHQVDPEVILRVCTHINGAGDKADAQADADLGN